jgi:hypothetical protein
MLPLADTLVVSGTLLCTAALLCEELKIHPIRDAFNHYTAPLQRTTIIKALKRGLELERIEKETLKVEVYKKELLEILSLNKIPNRLVFGVNPIIVWVHERDLHTLRTFFRKHFGSWTDKIERTSCTSSILDVRYRGTSKTPTLIEIEVDYDIDNLPPGLLKPGCRLEKEVETYESCYIVCES